MVLCTRALAVGLGRIKRRVGVGEVKLLRAGKVGNGAGLGRAGGADGGGPSPAGPVLSIIALTCLPSAARGAGSCLCFAERWLPGLCREGGGAAAVRWAPLERRGAGEEPVFLPGRGGPSCLPR